tara:strand:- start:1157 stop:1465 length:309 start_codon:yes stop_codon:yes gene_type:complete
MANSFVTNLYLVPTEGATSQRLTPDATTVEEFGAFNASTRVIFFDVQSNDIFMTLDGSTPTTTNGHKLFAGRSYSLSIQAARVAKFISATGTAVVYGTEMAS